MSIQRSTILRGTGKVTWNGATFFGRDDIVARHNPEWTRVGSSVHGTIDRGRKDFICTIPLRLWGAWENLSVLFPSAVLTPTPGTGIFGTSDLPLVIHGRNQDIITYHNAQLTKLADLYLGIDEGIFAADVEFTALIADQKNPEDASAYYTLSTGAYSDTTFAKTNYKQQRYSAAWGAVAGFTAFQAHQGWRISWNLVFEPDAAYSANIGTYDLILSDKEGPFIGRASCVPIGPTLAQLETAANAGANASNVLGRLLSGGQTAAADLVITGSGVSVTLKNAGIVNHGYAFGARPLRIGEVMWETTTAFSSGTAAARAVIA